MISEVALTGFKSFLNRNLKLERLTLLTGLNSSGKSSIIQALLMLERAANKENTILLEGHGSVEEIKNKSLGSELQIGAQAEDGDLFLIEIPLSPSEHSYNVINQLGFDFPEIIYVSANRFGPKTSMPIYNDSFKRNRMGANGENLFQCIESFSDYLIDGRLKHENSEGDTLLYNLRGWLSVVSPGIEFRYQLNKTSDSSYSTFDDHRATNVGFGLSYALPVITSLLIGSLIPYSLVIIENPEAHLHPKGQTEIARLISLCAQTGTQIIVETHSDHIFDGIRISVKNSGFAEKVQIHWFELDSNKNTEVYSPTLHNDGRIDEWPRGFFDQFEINASKLL